MNRVKRKVNTCSGEATVIKPPIVITIRQIAEAREIDVGQNIACKNATVGVIKTLKIYFKIIKISK